MPEIEFKNVTKIFGKKVKAVQDLSFIINDGEYVTLIGPSGCGKTTTLRLLAGLILPTKGQILFDNKNVEQLSIRDRNIGFVFQHFAIFPHMSVWDNVAYGPTVKGKSKREIEYLVENAIKAVGIEQRANEYPDNLGAPELQKTALARVIAAEAQILLLDEPLGALDQKIREEFQFFLRDLVKREGLTAIHVTHDQSEALSISDRVAVMNKGKLMQIGTKHELIFEPKNIFTSFFVGESDFIDGYVVDVNKEFTKVKVGKSVVKVKAIGLNRGERAVLGIRREFIEIKKQEETEQKEEYENYIRGKIIDDKFLGLFRRVNVLLENQQIIEAKIHAKYPIKFKPDELVKVIVNPFRTRCFSYPKDGIDAELSM